MEGHALQMFLQRQTTEFIYTVLSDVGEQSFKKKNELRLLYCKV